MYDSPPRPTHPAVANPTISPNNDSIQSLPLVPSPQSQPFPPQLLTQGAARPPLQRTKAQIKLGHFSLKAPDWRLIQEIRKTGGGVVGYVSRLTDAANRHFYAKGIEGAWGRMLLCNHFLSLNPKIRVPGSIKLSQQQLQDLLDHSKALLPSANDDSINKLINACREGVYHQIILMEDVGGQEIEDFVRDDVRALNLFNPTNPYSKAFLNTLGYVLGIDIFISNPDRLVKAKKHDNWHISLVPLGPQPIQDFILSTLDNESSLLYKYPGFDDNMYLEMITTADLSRAQRILSNYVNFPQAHTQILEMVGVEIIAEPELKTSKALIECVGTILKGIIFNINRRNDIDQDRKQQLERIQTLSLDSCILLMIEGVEQARNRIFDQMEPVLPLFLQKQTSDHPVFRIFKEVPNGFSDVAFNLATLILRYKYLKDRQSMSMKKAQIQLMKSFEEMKLNSLIV
jgi:hypothetical protein